MKCRYAFNKNLKLFVYLQIIMQFRFSTKKIDLS